jgi:hypothetical protein
MNEIYELIGVEKIFSDTEAKVLYPDLYQEAKIKEIQLGIKFFVAKKRNGDVVIISEPQGEFFDDEI